MPSPYPDGFSDVDRLKLSDAIDDARYALALYRTGSDNARHLADAIEALIPLAEDVDRELKEYR